MVISILNQKGGVGKTTIAINLAIEFAKNNFNILLIDADKQASASEFKRTREEEADNLKKITVNQILIPTIHKDIEKYKKSFNPIIIDVGGRDDKVFRSSIVASDIIIIPFTPSAVDFWSSEDTLQIINEIRVSKELKIFGLLNMVLSGTKIADDVNELIEQFKKEYEIDFFKTRIFSRIAYKYSFANGLGVTEIQKNKDNKAIKEMEKLFKEIKKTLKH